MKTLQDAWDWYQSAKTNLMRMKRLGSNHWEDDSLQTASIWQDDRFKQLSAEEIISETNLALEPLEDLGILVLFSVFEATIREHFEAIIKPSVDNLDPLLKSAGDRVMEGIRHGSFTRQILDPFKVGGRITPELSDNVKQVRDYRNWVAHGKREPRDASIVNLKAEDAFERLRFFLDELGISITEEFAD
jgi:hypothetical protein